MGRILDEVNSGQLLRQLMRRQLRLSISVALSFLVVLLGLPAANFLFPELMSMNVGGFTLSWLILGLLFFPWVWTLSWFFIRRTSQLEKEEVELARRASTSTSARRDGH